MSIKENKGKRNETVTQIPRLGLMFMMRIKKVNLLWKLLFVIL